jgi:CDGSH-type Zn-finger protein/truncated hemoglobin YjbI/ferredoxin
MTVSQLHDLTHYAHETRRLAQDLAASSNAAGSTASGAPPRRIWAALIDSAARVLSQASTAFGQALDADEPPRTVSSDPPQPLGDRLWDLTRGLTALTAHGDLPASLDEAVAALQTSSCVFAEPGSDVTARLTVLRETRREASGRLRLQPNGPYVGTNVEKLNNWLGEEIAVPPLIALCRCGGSAIKPFCDGAHARNHFNDAKDPKRVGDRQDTYVGQQLTVLDNRGTCAHSGFCTDRLASVFHQGDEAFVTPSGARMDDIIRAVRACPSGALSFAIDGHESRDQVDSVRPPAIEVSKDGPYRVTGGIPLVDQDGAPVERNTGASLEHYSLCRCGQSRNKPFCSGMHWYVGFRDPVADADRQPTLFEWAGGLPALTRMTRLFYGKYVPEDPLIGPLFASMSPDHPERVAAWLGEVFGGPKRYSERYGGYTRMLSQHLGKALTEAQRARWVSLMCRSADEAGVPADAEFRASFVAYLEWGSRLALENSQPGAKPPPQMPMPRWWWVCDATPGSRVSALAHEVEDETPSAPAPDETVTFSAHVRPLFRRVDRQSMLFAFDLWAYDDVVRHAAEILRRVENGTMPCDGAWPTAKVETFRRWVEAGAPA